MRTIKLMRSTVWGILQQVLNIFSNIIITPMIIINFGSDVNGLISASRQVLSYLQLVGGGISAASIQLLYNPLAQRNINGINENYSASRWFFIKAGNIFSLLSIGIAVIYPFFIKSEIEAPIVFFIILISAINGASEFYIIGAYRTLLIADQKSYILSIMQIIGIILNSSTIILMVYISENILNVLFLSTLAYLLRIIYLKWYVKRSYRFLKKVNKSGIPKIENRWSAFLHSVANVIILNTPIVMISVLLGTKYASVYSVYMLVFSGINLISNSFTTGFMSTIGNILSSENKTFLIRIYKIFEMVSYLSTAIFYTCTAILIIPFLKIYTKDITDFEYVDNILALLFIIWGVVNALRIPAATTIIAMGHFRETKWHVIIELLLNLILQLTLINFLGIYGVLLAGIFSSSYRSIVTLIYFHRIYSWKETKTMKSMFRNMLSGLVIYLFFFSFINIEVETYFSFALYGFFAFTFSFLILIGVNYFSDKESFNRIYIKFKEIIVNKIK